jgi:hypothetical protein
MARTFVNGFGPFNNQISSLLETTGTSFPTGWSAPSSPSPPHGTYWIKVDATASVDLDFGESVDAVSSDGYDWLCIRGFRLNGILSSGEDGVFITVVTTSLSPIGLRWVYSSSTDKWKIQIVRSAGTGSETALGTGTTEFSTDTTYNIRLEFSGAAIKLWVNGSLELSVAYTGNINNRRLRVHSDLNTGQAYFLNRVALYTSSAENDRPGTNVESDYLTFSGDTSEDDYATEADCSVGASGDATYTKWDDWESGAPDDGTTFNCGAGEDWSQLSALNTHTVDGVVSGVVYRIWYAANAASKTVDNWARLGDGTNTVEVQLPNIDSEDYRSRIRVFDTAPDGGAWVQADIDNLEAGHRVVDANNAVAHISAVAAEVIAVDDDPPSLLRTGGQVI